MNRPTFSLAIIATLALVSEFPVSAATRGAIETFSSQNNADSWTVYDFADDTSYFPLWNSAPSSGDPDIYFEFTDDAPFLIFADPAASAASFTGNYTAARISAVGCDIFIEDFDSFDGADFYFYSDVDGRYYYSRYFDTFTYFIGSGWDAIETAFLGAEWFADENGSLIQVALTPDSLRSVSEMGVRCFPFDATADATIIAIDNFYLVPELATPTLQLNPGTSGSLTGSFPMVSGQIYDLWTSENLIDWVRLEAYSDLTGPGTTFYTVEAGPETYLQLRTDEFYSAVPDVGP